MTALFTAWLCAAAFAVVYLQMAFIQWELDPSVWSEFARVVTVFLGSTAAMLVVLWRAKV